jgi:hypothetical protein
MSKGARVRAQRVQAPQKRGGKVKTPSAPGQSGSRRNLYLGVIGAVVVLAAILVGASVLSNSGGSSKPPASTLADVGATNKLLAGIPQNGTTLGDP